MKRLLAAVMVVLCLGVGGCTMPGDWWPFGGPGAVYSSNTADEASNFNRP
jgi:hypothetical protein